MAIVGPGLAPIAISAPIPDSTGASNVTFLVPMPTTQTTLTIIIVIKITIKIGGLTVVISYSKVVVTSDPSPVEFVATLPNGAEIMSSEAFYNALA